MEQIFPHSPHKVPILPTLRLLASGTARQYISDFDTLLWQPSLTNPVPFIPKYTQKGLSWVIVIGRKTLVAILKNVFFFYFLQSTPMYLYLFTCLCAYGLFLFFSRKSSLRDSMDQQLRAQPQKPDWVEYQPNSSSVTWGKAISSLHVPVSSSIKWR